MSAKDVQKMWHVGIDLGTSNSVVSIFQDGLLSSEETIFSLTQFAASGLASELPSLASALYAPLAEESSLLLLDPLLSDSSKRFILGSYARDMGALRPERVITSSKSWLSHSALDRESALLPWGSEASVPHLSPVDAAKEILSLINRQLVKRATEEGIKVHAEVVITVPASFDDVARTLTSRAATGAQFEKVIMLEEPQSAFYSWLYRHHTNWRDLVRPNDCILVIDIGGGTTDFSLIEVHEDKEGELVLSRLSVGQHILLGGDNMDLALAYALRTDLKTKKITLDKWQFQSLIHHVREAKEKLLSGNHNGSVKFSVAKRGSDIFGSSVEGELTQSLVQEVVLKGFFPEVSMEQCVAEHQEVLSESGLPYARDAAVTRHLLAFLNRSTRTPSHVLFNGGVCEAPLIRAQVVEYINKWTGSSIVELGGISRANAVAEGAAYYAYLRSTGKGVRVKAGAPRTLYLGVERNRPAVPGIAPEVYGICIVPKGTEEGTTFSVPTTTLSVALNSPVQFSLFASDSLNDESTRATVRQEVGQIVEDINDSLEPFASVISTCKDENAQRGERASVFISSTVNDGGLLELALVDKAASRRWTLEFNLRS